MQKQKGDIYQGFGDAEGFEFIILEVTVTHLVICWTRWVGWPLYRHNMSNIRSLTDERWFRCLNRVKPA